MPINLTRQPDKFCVHGRLDCRAPNPPIAESLGLTLSNTKSRIQRGRVKLKERFLECCVVSFGESGEMVSFDIKPECTALKDEQTKIENIV